MRTLPRNRIPNRLEISAFCSNRVSGHYGIFASDSVEVFQVSGDKFGKVAGVGEVAGSEVRLFLREGRVEEVPAFFFTETGHP